MKVEISFRNLEPTDAIVSMIEKKAQHFNKYHHKDMNVHWVCLVKDQVHRSDVNITSNLGTFHASAEDDNLYKTFDEVIPKLEKQLDKKRSDRPTGLKTD
jgi:putative sigma-54 modulation protein